MSRKNLLILVILLLSIICFGLYLYFYEPNNVIKRLQLTLKQLDVL